MLATSTEENHNVEAKRWGGVVKEYEDVFGGVERQSGEPVETVLIVSEEKRGKEPTCEEDIEVDLADGDTHGIYEDVYLTNVGEKLGQRGKELGKELASYDKTNTYGNRMDTTTSRNTNTTRNAKKNGDENSNDNSSSRSPLPSATVSYRAGGAYKVKHGMKRHRQLRPMHAAY